MDGNARVACQRDWLECAGKLKLKVLLKKLIIQFQILFPKVPELDDLLGINIYISENYTVFLLEPGNETKKCYLIFLAHPSQKKATGTDFHSFQTGEAINYVVKICRIDGVQRFWIDGVQRFRLGQVPLQNSGSIDHCMCPYFPRYAHEQLTSTLKSLRLQQPRKASLNEITALSAFEDKIRHTAFHGCCSSRYTL
uniref:Uncharacterized protein n=1 Tax=Romanomermis culicivorax TaxID=13658 RepID=A0A915IZM1_ROMCU